MGKFSTLMAELERFISFEAFKECQAWALDYALDIRMCEYSVFSYTSIGKACSAKILHKINNAKE